MCKGNINRMSGATKKKRATVSMATAQEIKEKRKTTIPGRFYILNDWCTVGYNYRI